MAPSPSTVTSRNGAVVRRARSSSRRSGRAAGAAGAARGDRFAPANAIAMPGFTPCGRSARGAFRTAILAGPWTSATSPSKVRSGVGKSALADRLGARLDATVVLDETDNPFLADFYAERPGAGFQTQLFFTLGAPPAADVAAPARSLQPAHDLRLPVRARQDLRLPESRRQRALHLSAPVRAAGAGPADARSRDLPADADRRAAPPPARARRAAKATRRIPDDRYVRELNEAYNHFFFHYTATPLLVVETSQFDLTWGEDAVADIERQMRGMGKGTRYYVPRT